MNVNFDIRENYALQFEGRHIDLHNNFDFAGFEYHMHTREFILCWTKTNGDWVPQDELSQLTLIHKEVTYLAISDTEEQTYPDDRKCLSDITYFPSSERDVNNSIMMQSKPNPDDDILYIFENAQTIRIHCAEIQLLIE